MVRLCRHSRFSVPLLALLIASTVPSASSASAQSAPGFFGPVAWGGDALDDFNEAVPPPLPQLADVVAVEGGDGFSLALRSDGTVIQWGGRAPGPIPPGATGVVAISTRSSPECCTSVAHVLALKNDGTIVGWGNNRFGQATIPPGATPAVAVEAGHYHSVALRTDGTVVAWGFNEQGQATVPPGLTDVIAIAAGRHHNLALKRDGTVVGWGENGFGETTPPAGLSNVIAIAASDYSLALKADGTLVAWGNDDADFYPPPGLTGVTAIALGFAQSAARKADGTVAVWPAEGDQPPVGLHDVQTISAGARHFLAIGRRPCVSYLSATYSEAAGGLLIRQEIGTSAPENIYRAWMRRYAAGSEWQEIASFGLPMIDPPEVSWRFRPHVRDSSHLYLATLVGAGADNYCMQVKLIDLFP